MGQINQKSEFAGEVKAAAKIFAGTLLGTWSGAGLVQTLREDQTPHQDAPAAASALHVTDVPLSDAPPVVVVQRENLEARLHELFAQGFLGGYKDETAKANSDDLITVMPAKAKPAAADDDLFSETSNAHAKPAAVKVEPRKETPNILAPIISIFTEKKTAVTSTPAFSHASADHIPTPGYAISPEYKTALLDATTNDPVSYDLLYALIGSESAFKDQDSPSGCIGLGQFCKATLIEALYINKNLLPDAAQKTIEKNIVRFDIAPKGQASIWRYKFKDGLSAAEKTATYDLARDADVAFPLIREHVRHATIDGTQKYNQFLDVKINTLIKSGDKSAAMQDRIAALQANRKREMTFADAKIFYMCGATGGAQFLAAMADPVTANQRAASYAPACAPSNKWVFKFADQKLKQADGTMKTIEGAWRTPDQVYTYIRGIVGDGILPASLKRPQSVAMADITISASHSLPAVYQIAVYEPMAA